MNIFIQQPAKIEVFTTIFQSLKGLTDQVNIQFDQDRMYIQAMDSAHLSILEVSLPRGWFCQYECGGGGAGAEGGGGAGGGGSSVVLGINTGLMHKILAARDKNQSIRVVYEADSDMVSIHMCVLDDKGEPVAKAGFDRHFEAPLMDIEAEYLGIPVIEYDMEMTLPAVVFSTMIQQLRGFGDSLDICCGEDLVRLTATTQDSGSMSVNIRMDDLVEYAIVEDTELKLSFGLQHLQTVCAYSKVTKNAVVKMHSAYPLCVDYPLELGGFIHFFLAPKISEE
jgi:proliferating cell nuclear antigen